MSSLTKTHNPHYSRFSPNVSIILNFLISFSSCFVKPAFSANIDVEFTRKEHEGLKEFSARILSIYNPDDYVSKSECVGNTCKCLLPAQWQADKFPSERTDLYFFFDKSEGGSDVDCNEEMNWERFVKSWLFGEKCGYLEKGDFSGDIVIFRGKLTVSLLKNIWKFRRFFFVILILFS